MAEGGWRGEAGQSTLEFLVVSLVVVAVAMGLAAIARLAADGTLLAHAVSEASHTLGQQNVGVLGDVVFY